MYQLMSNVQLPGSRTFYSQILIHPLTPKHDASLAKEFQKYLSKDDRKHGVIDKLKYRKYPVKENGHTDSIIFKIMLMFHTKM